MFLVAGQSDDASAPILDRASHRRLRAYALGFRAQGLRFRVYGLGFRFQGLYWVKVQGEESKLGFFRRFGVLEADEGFDGGFAV